MYEGERLSSGAINSDMPLSAPDPVSGIAEPVSYACYSGRRGLHGLGRVKLSLNSLSELMTPPLIASNKWGGRMATRFPRLRR